VEWALLPAAFDFDFATGKGEDPWRHPEVPRFHQRDESLPWAKPKGISNAHAAAPPKLAHYCDLSSVRISILLFFATFANPLRSSQFKALLREIRPLSQFAAH